MRKKLLLVFLSLLVFSCQKEKSEWNPIFEETNFDYFTTSIERSLSMIDDAYSKAKETDEAAIQETLIQAKDSLLAIKDYYIPLTIVRQKTYDAERYLKLNDIKNAKQLMDDSKAKIMSLGSTTTNTVFDRVILDLNAKIDQVIASLDANSKKDAYDKLKTLGEQVNMMLYKGDLVLSGIEFDK